MASQLCGLAYQLVVRLNRGGAHQLSTQPHPLLGAAVLLQDLELVQWYVLMMQISGIEVALILL